MLKIAAFVLLALNYILFFASATPWLAALFKVLPLWCLIAWAYTQAPQRRLLFPALLLGTCGDALLAFNLFIPGLLAFLLGHLCYSALWVKTRKSTSWVTALPAAGLMLMSLWFILPAVGELLVPVLIYLLVIGAMAVLASRSTLLDVWGMLGVYSFLVSDFIIAWNEFISPLAWSAPAIMVTYYLAQFLICVSVVRHSSRHSVEQTEGLQAAS